MKTFKILIHYPVECEYLDICEDSDEAFETAIDFAMNDARELAGTMGIKTWEDVWNQYVDEILDMSIEAGKEFIDEKYEEYLRALVHVEVLDENTEL